MAASRYLSSAWDFLHRNREENSANGVSTAKLRACARPESGKKGMKIEIAAQWQGAYASSVW